MIDPRKVVVLVEQEGPDGAGKPGRSVEDLADGGPWRIVTGADEVLLLWRVEADGDEDDHRPVTLCGPIGSEGRILDVIAGIATSRWTGTLYASGGGARRDLHFNSGALRWAGSNETCDRLGEVMHRMGRISRLQLDDALAQTGPDRRIGEALVRSGAATDTDVFTMITRQVEEVFWATLVMRGGAFWFREGADPGGIPVHVSLDTNNLLLEGVRRIDEMAYFRKLIPGANIVLQRKSRSFPPRSAGGTVDDLFLGLCDGARTIADIARDAGIGEFEATRLAFQYLQEQAIEVVPTEDTRDDSMRFVVDRFNEMIDRIAEAVGEVRDPSKFLAAVRAFPNSGGELEHFAHRISLTERGHLEVRNLTSVLQDITVEKRMGTLLQVLTQYIFFALFLSDRHLPREHHRRVSAEVHDLMQKIGA